MSENTKGSSSTTSKAPKVTARNKVSRKHNRTGAQSAPPLPPSGSSFTLPLFVAVNSGCNMACGYCPELGENRDTIHGKLPFDTLARYTRLAYIAGIRTFRATGGEPTLRRDLGEYLTYVQSLGDDVRVAITTNGTKLRELIDVLGGLISPKVFVSIDATDPSGVTGTFPIEKVLTAKLDETIRLVRDVADVRVNMVLTSGTRSQVRPLMAYCAEVGIDLKIFELLHRDYYYAGDSPSLTVFANEYVPVRDLVAELTVELGQSEPYGGTGGKGIPMRAFDNHGSNVVYFDSLGGSHYGDGCLTCDRYPCQEGLYALVLSSTGLLAPAGCTDERFHTRLDDLTDEQVVSAFTGLADVINAGTFSSVIPSYLEPWRDDGIAVSIRPQ